MSKKKQPKKKSSKTPKVWEAYRKHLLTMREDLLRTVQRKKEKDMPEQEVGDEADAALQSMERELFFELSDNERLMIDAIDAALRKLDQGTFGRCESCGKRIAQPRLKAMPYARYCVGCQARFESPSA
jgi:DnaK suppressor protein